MGSLPLLSGGGHNLAVGQQGWPSGKNPDVRQDRARQTRPARTKQNPWRQTGACVAGPSPAGPGLPTEEASSHWAAPGPGPELRGAVGAVSPAAAPRREGGRHVSGHGQMLWQRLYLCPEPGLRGCCFTAPFQARHKFSHSHPSPGTIQGGNSGKLSSSLAKVVLHKTTPNFSLPSCQSPVGCLLLFPWDVPHAGLSRGSSRSVQLRKSSWHSSCDDTIWTGPKFWVLLSLEEVNLILENAN